MTPSPTLACLLKRIPLTPSDHQNTIKNRLGEDSQRHSLTLFSSLFCFTLEAESPDESSSSVTTPDQRVCGFGGIRRFCRQQQGAGYWSAIASLPPQPCCSPSPCSSLFLSPQPCAPSCQLQKEELVQFGDRQQQQQQLQNNALVPYQVLAV